MKQSTFTDEQIVAVLAEAEKGDKTITALCKERAITEQTFYRWRNKAAETAFRLIRRDAKQRSATPTRDGERECSIEATSRGVRP